VITASDSSDVESGEEDNEEDADKERTRLPAILKKTPPWLVSTALHTLAITALALVTFVNVQQEEKDLFLVASPVDETQRLEELTEVEIEQMEEIELQEVLVSASEIDPGRMTFGDISSPAEVRTDMVGEISIPDTAINEIGALFGDEGSGMADISDGLKAAATFFGAKAQGTRFCFVVDNSNSMGKGKFETALIEIVKAVNKLGPRQYFYVVFYSDTAYPLFYPSPSKGMVPATEENKQRLEYWLNTMQMCLQTRGEDAMKLALSQRPDVLFLLGDGAFTDRTAKLLVSRPVPNVVIHSLGMQVNQKNAIEFAAIAKAHRGTYRDVGVTAQGYAMLKEMGPRPKNNARNGIWGIKLGGRK
jgi:hypothetical protein